MKKRIRFTVLTMTFLVLTNCQQPKTETTSEPFKSSYLDYSNKDDQKTYMNGLIKFIKGVGDKTF